MVPKWSKITQDGLKNIQDGPEMNPIWPSMAPRKNNKMQKMAFLAISCFCFLLPLQRPAKQWWRPRRGVIFGQGKTILEHVGSRLGGKMAPKWPKMAPKHSKLALRWT